MLRLEIVIQHKNISFASPYHFSNAKISSNIRFDLRHCNVLARFKQCSERECKTEEKNIFSYYTNYV